MSKKSLTVTLKEKPLRKRRLTKRWGRLMEMLKAIDKTRRNLLKYHH